MAIFKKKTGEAKAPIIKSGEVNAVAAPVAETKAEKTVLGLSRRPLLERPWISEKALIAGTRSQYVFSVRPEATKPAVRDEVQRRYGVHVMAVRMVRFTGKQRYFRGKMSHKMVQKKAIVTLRAGEKIEIQ
ncbi:50S ribosomal protein L23 [Patescibacteria group bacterium]|nr:50S ribosomal protein L23 [Patescibacteria group bacterium]